MQCMAHYYLPTNTSSLKCNLLLDHNWFGIFVKYNVFQELNDDYCNTIVHSYCYCMVAVKTSLQRPGLIKIQDLG